MAIRTGPGTGSGNTNQIYAAGYAAGQSGERWSSNPYPLGSPAANTWMVGWQAGFNTPQGQAAARAAAAKIGSGGGKHPGPQGKPKTGNLQQGAAGANWQPCTLTWYDPALGGTNSASGAANPTARMANGQPYSATANTCAAPPNYSFGTQITFQYGGKQVTCTVTDRGGAIQGSHFDLARAPATALGIINAGTVSAQFMVGQGSGSPAGGGSGSGGGSGGGGANVLTILEDIATLNISDLAVQMALAGITVIKDVTLGIADFIIIPFWQWNQRAVQYFIQTDLFSQTDPTVTPWTAAFWGLGYWLLWTEHGSRSLKPAPVRASRLAHHTRALQSIPARRSLVKPKDVKRKTPKKPKPVISVAPVTQTGTMRATRALPVKVHGEHATRSEARVQPEGTVTGSRSSGRGGHGPRPAGQSDSKHRARDSSLPNRSRHP